MSLEKELLKRAESKCELCGSESDLKPFDVSPKGGNVDGAILTCGICHEQLADNSKIEANHWRCLNDSMWSTVPAVQVVAYRMLNQLKSEGWPQDLLDMMYMEEDTAAWAKEGVDDDDSEAIIHKDSNGVVLQNGDSVVVIKDLNVKGSSIVAKRGEAVRNISLVWDNAEQIEGKVGFQQVVLLTKYVKKTS
jgi:protein PhnA